MDNVSVRQKIKAASISRQELKYALTFCMFATYSLFLIPRYDLYIKDKTKNKRLIATETDQ